MSGMPEHEWLQLPDEEAADLLRSSVYHAMTHVASCLEQVGEFIESNDYIHALPALREAMSHLNMAGAFATAGAARWQPAAFTHQMDQSRAAIRDIASQLGVDGIVFMPP